MPIDYKRYPPNWKTEKINHKNENTFVVDFFYSFKKHLYSYPSD